MTHISRKHCKDKPRPDILLYRNKSKHVVMLELTVPWEERMDEDHKKKRGTCAELVEDCHCQGVVDSMYA